MDEQLEVLQSRMNHQADSGLSKRTKQFFRDRAALAQTKAVADPTGKVTII